MYVHPLTLRRLLYETNGSSEVNKIVDGLNLNCMIGRPFSLVIASGACPRFSES